MFSNAFISLRVSLKMQFKCFIYFLMLLKGEGRKVSPSATNISRVHDREWGDGERGGDKAA
jgi:hypothetical protein